jgi:uncharacterized membrane protein YfcA
MPHTPALIAGLLAVGAVVGFLSGMMGKGGSAVTTPALQVFLGVPDYLALASPLPATLPTLLSAAFAYRGEDLLDWRVIGFVTAFGAPATVAGSYASRFAGGHPLMVVSAALVFALGLSLVPEGAAPPASPRPPEAWKLAVLGACVGAFSGLLANAGGILFGPLFIRWLRLPPKKALACSLVCAATLAVPATVTHVLLGHVDWVIVAALSVAALPSSYMGARLAIRMKDKTLVRVYGVLLALFGLYDLWYTLR